MTIARLSLIVAVCFIIACSSSRSIKIWDAKSYGNNSNSQMTAAQHALSRIVFEKGEAVIDIGCGDGKITAGIAQELNGGSVVGIDLSAAMIDFAKENFSSRHNLSFVQMDAAQLNFEEKFTTAVSFSAMQWVGNQSAALKGIFRALKPEGRFLMMIPAGYPPALEKALGEMMADADWREFYKNFERGQTFYSKEEYETLFKESGFTDVVVERIPAFDRFENLKAFSNFVRQWLPHLTPIPMDKRNAFMDQLMVRYSNHMPPSPDGSVVFDKYSLEALVKKPG